jgi:predicted alpha-1,2-mannosidase
MESVKKHLRNHLHTILLSLLGAGLVVSCKEKKSEQDYAAIVNPFIGTTAGGNTFPGATTPWGMVSLSPHTNEPSSSGFLYEKKFITGFGHVHLSGVGCPELGSIIIMPTKGKLSLDQQTYQSNYEAQEAKAGYYKVELSKYKLKVETTAASRSGVMKVTNTGNKDTVRIVLDAGNSLSAFWKNGRAEKVSSSAVKGFNTVGGFCDVEFASNVYFYTQASSVPFNTYLWHSGVVTEKANVVQSDSSAVGAVFEYVLDKGESVSFHTGISYTSEDAAKRNLEADQPELSFTKTLNQAQSSWNKELSKVQIETDNSEDKINFYSALYHMLLQPALFSDADGGYRAFQSDSVLHSKLPRHSVFSLWDTYRTVHPFYTLVYPEKQKHMVETMLGMYRESGWLPKWEVAGNETFVMVGDPASIVIADSWMKGIEPLNKNEAYEAIQKSSITPGVDGLSNPIRPGWAAYKEYGFIPIDDDREPIWGPVSSSLEYALADFGISQISARLGKKQDQDAFLKKANVFREYFDSSTKFLRPKNKSGEWFEPFHPDTIDNAYDPWLADNGGGPGYVEGNAWHYSWFVPHAILELIKLYGPTHQFVEHFDQLFERGHFVLWNQPDMNYPYIYNYIKDQEYKTSKIVLENLRKHFNNQPAGLPGNDDCGTTSGWYVFASLGFYPFCPATVDYALNVPLFKKATIYLNENDHTKKWVIENTVHDHKDLKSVKMKVNGIALDKPWIDHATILKGGTLTYYQ